LRGSSRRGLHLHVDASRRWDGPACSRRAGCFPAGIGTGTV
jgi:hypothetical protein